MWATCSGHSLQTSILRLHVARNAYRGSGLPDGITSGEAAAQRVRVSPLNVSILQCNCNDIAKLADENCAILLKCS